MIGRPPRYTHADPLFSITTRFRSNRRARLLKLLFVRRIDACCELGPRLVTLAARVRKTDGRPGAECQRAVSPEIFVVHAPQLASVGPDEQKEAVAIGELIVAVARSGVGDGGGKESVHGGIAQIGRAQV